ncbi:Inositol monophosphatase 2 [Penicillium cosmopolitanum]|uniref:Inositol-1-monophosphatase n=1 Tax=Penicillium cosmopolitanum TaxID=1131564 RepID=A0A9W9VZW2_9EURO|nr:Inositol monophosphatase 2 [Penicillium cosmopolitanum]KAJ5392372.1 Inositol monophosphatase 2 [Penicillium cosmopolitanum]
MATPNLNDIHDTLIDLAYKAGDIINNALPDISGPGSKKNSADLVTEYDRAVETMISTSLKEKYPDYAPTPPPLTPTYYTLTFILTLGSNMLSPASTAKKPTPQQPPLTNAPTFIIDPIDGTINFIHNFPHACVSLGFAINKIPTVGIVYNPSTKTLYSAIKGQGAFKNQSRDNSQRERLPLRKPEPLTGLSNALLAIEWGSDRSGPNWTVKTRTFEKLGASKEDGGAMVRSFRSLGSAALNICAVAEGVVDVYWEGGLLGVGCLCWAGGLVVDGNPGRWEDEVSLDGRRYLVIRGAEEKGQREIVEEFWGFIQGRLTY